MIDQAPVKLTASFEASPAVSIPLRRRAAPARTDRDLLPVSIQIGILMAADSQAAAGRLVKEATDEPVPKL